ncbi:carboxymuconolactone decarboxylase family protein [Saccharopolyspora pogona]|uniref:hypothetical protein n=1 Tax=Saccharopolyspora pogona TaxID=333966 RepID=UPI001CC24FEE|nr:hypothetical protein [Saccharopolyspora pogona]
MFVVRGFDQNGLSDEDYRPAAEHFDRTQLVRLVWTVSLINTDNRLAVTMVPC